jgi:hypothetical protein
MYSIGYTQQRQKYGAQYSPLREQGRSLGIKDEASTMLKIKQYSTTQGEQFHELSGAEEEEEPTRKRNHRHANAVLPPYECLQTLQWQEVRNVPREKKTSKKRNATNVRTNP